MPGTPIRILLDEDDDDDYVLTTQALKENRLVNPVHRVHDGVELLEYFQKQGRYASPESAPPPSLILLDLNMPRKDGRETLREIKAKSTLRHLPIVILTTSRVQEDIVRSCGLGVNAFISKPVSSRGLVEASKALGCYWFEVVELPQEERNGLRRTA